MGRGARNRSALRILESLRFSIRASSVPSTVVVRPVSVASASVFHATPQLCAEYAQPMPQIRSLAIRASQAATLGWPLSSTYLIGTLAGISLIMSGWSYVMIALAARRIAG